MIRYYTYYNYGGYKSLYLGDDKDTNEYRYFLPLLPILEKKVQENPEDETLKEKVDEMKSLPHLEVITVSSKNHYSAEASNAITHGGYKMIYRTSQGGRRFIALRDIKGDNDDYGREASFMMLWESDSNSDIPMMDALACYIMSKCVKFEQGLSGLFSYNAKYNGLRFSVGEMNRILNGRKEFLDYKNLTEGPLIQSLKNPDCEVKILLLPSGSDIRVAIRELNIKPETIGIKLYLNGGDIPVSATGRQTSGASSQTKEKANMGLPRISDVKRELENMAGELRGLWDSLNKMNLLSRIEQLEKENELLRTRIEKLESAMGVAE